MSSSPAEQATSTPPDEEPPDSTNSNSGKRRQAEKKSKGWKRAKGTFIRDDASDGGYGHGASRSPHPGSYANAGQRERFGVAVPEEPGASAVAPDQNATEQTIVKRAKRKFALLLGYVGSGYSGFQMNEEQRTIQADVELALLRSGLLLRSNFGCPSKYGWSVSGRTDKGVHAAGQVVSCKLEVFTEESAGTSGLTSTEDDIRNLINEHLPSSMQVLDVVRTTRNFCAKTQRHRVRYQYLVPSFMLHGNLSELFGSAAPDPESDTPLLSRERVLELQSQLVTYRASPRQLDALRIALSTYHGTHSFHNFTKRMTTLEDRSKRFIESFEAGDPILLSGLEWIPTTVVGQSFLLHQIRKMIGLALLVASEASSSRTVDELKHALSCADSVRVPTAPAQGLFLDMSVYETYNHRKNMSQNSEVQDILWGREGESPAQERYLAFRDRLLDHVGKQELEEANFLQYLFKQYSANRDTISSSNLDDQTKNPGA
jgi:tRNA pseudouridine38-40 synthase